jgi:branched-chain amino acid aminotransferase
LPLHTYINFNGAVIHSDKTIINADNRGFRYGDGLFETIKITGNKIILADYHFERLFSGMQVLQFDKPVFFTRENLSDQILELCKKNNHQQSARVRLVVFRRDGGLYDVKNNFPDYIIQTWKLENKHFTLNENGLIADVFVDGKKACDNFSNIKSNNFLIYTMAAFYAKNNQLNDCFILNTHERICETTISNIFIIKDKVVCTPALTEGCIAGVMRRYLIEKIKNAGFDMRETILSTENIKDADEIFLSNSISGIRWVKQFREIEYTNILTKEIFNAVLKDIF